ncbi:type II toxin-antitoxin system YafQ family toxin [Rubneribacter sp.]|nr:type II toxin-antitoxin system YafQ family toxin [Candidatus Rubneribacter avistercoris]
MRLKATFTPSFARDLKRIRKRGFNEHDLLNVIDLIIENTADSREELRRRHRMHSLKGAWKGSSEYHVANAGDWLVVWREHDGVAFFQRIGTHDEIFR